MATQSPCIGLCTLEKPDNICVGCFRNLDEIIDWSMFSDEEKKSVIVKCEKRRAEHPPTTKNDASPPHE